MMADNAQLAQIVAAAQAARQSGRVADEARLLDQAVRLAPDSAQVQNALGLSALGRHAFGAAIAAFRQATTLVPDEPSLWVNLATAARGQGDDALEREALGRTLDLDRRHFMAQLRLAQLNERTGDTRAAVRGWQAVVQLAAGIADPPPAIAELVEHGRRFIAAETQAIEQRLGDQLANPPSRRFQACLDHAFGRRRIYANQCEGLHFPFLPAEEFFDRAQFPWMAALEARTDAIRAEALALMRDGGEAIRPYVRQEKGVPQNKWTPLDHSLDWSACFLWEYGVRNDAVCARCPETAAALADVPQTDIPGRAPTAFFSILRPRAHIPAHTGVTNTRTIVHLPLVVPDGARFRVGGETRAWREGEAFAFDDTIEHEAWNDSDEIRIVLILDVWNPYLTPDERTALRAFFEAT